MAHHGLARPGQQSSTVGLNPPSHRALSALRVRVRLHCTAVNRNPDIISSPHISPLLLSPLPLFPHAKPSLSVSSPSRGEPESLPRHDPRAALQGQFLWLPALPSSSHEETCLVAQSGHSEAGSARGKSRGKFGGSRAAAGIVRATMVLSTGVLSQ